MTLLYGHHISVVAQCMILAMRTPEKGKMFFSKSVSALRVDDFQELISLLGMTNLQSETVEEFIGELDDGVDGWLDGKKQLPCTLNELFEKSFIGDCIFSPEGLSQLGLLESVDFYSHNAELDKPTQENKQKQFARYRVLLSDLETHISNNSATTSDEKLSTEILKWTLLNKLAGEKFMNHSYAIEQMDGIHVGLMLTLTDLSPLNNLRDVDHYFTRLENIPARLLLVEEEIDLQRELSIVPPEFVLEKVAKTLVEMIEEMKEKDESLLVTCLKNSKAFSVEEGNTERLNVHLETAKKKVKAFVLPAYESLLKKVRETIPFCSPGVSGVGTLPQGQDYYAWCLQSETTTDLTPEEIHLLGQKEVANLIKEMKDTCESLRHRQVPGFEDQNKSAVQLVKELCETDFYLESEKDLILEDFRRLTRDIESQVDDIFPVKPKAKCKIEKVPDHMEEGSPGAFYFPPALDGSREGTFYVNMGDIKAVYKCGMRTLTAHEAIPGHHFQIALAHETEGIPYFRKTSEGFNAYVEGWGLYAEKLAREIGFYRTEEDGSEGKDLLGHFSDELLRASRLVVDTGLHHFHWSRAQANEYMEKNTTLAPSDVIAEVDRYCVLPGQATSYKIGQLELLKKRKDYLAKTTTENERKEQLKKFHKLILLAGAVPLHLLDTILRP